MGLFEERSSHPPALWRVAATWNLFGTYTVGIENEVQLGGSGNGRIIADALKYVPLNSAPPTATWTATLTPGSYQVYVKWTSTNERATNAKYTVTHGGGQDTVTVNQRANSGAWNLLGTYTFGATGTVSLSSDADGYVIADAVKFVPASAGFDTATWTPNASGTYEVYARWSNNTERASNAKYTVTHTGGQSTVTVDQRANGGAWNLLGTYALNAQSTVTLSSQANGYVIADAIRLLPAASSQPAALYYVHTDHLGTPRAVFSQQNQTLWRWEGEAFGNAPANEDADGNTIPLAYNLRFPGQYADRETNLHYNGARDYDPATGRYPSADPLGLNGGDLSLYLYAKNNPLSFIDPEGLAWINGQRFDPGPLTPGSFFPPTAPQLTPQPVPCEIVCLGQALGLGGAEHLGIDIAAHYSSGWLKAVLTKAPVVSPFLFRKNVQACMQNRCPKPQMCTAN